MRVLVTGGAGFIGSNYILHRFEEGDDDLEILNVDTLTYASDPAFLAAIEDHQRYRFAKTDVADRGSIDSLLNDFKPQVIVHFAAETHVDRSIASGEPFVHTNVRGTQVLLDAARRHDIDGFLHVGTDEVYGSTKVGSFKETDPLRPSSPYSATKAGADLLALAYHTTYGLPVVITRCTNNYGPHQHEEKLLPKVIRNALQDKPIPIYGTGTNVRDWLYVRDHCAAIDAVLKARRWGEVFNIAGGNEMTNLDFVRHVLKVLHKPESLIHLVDDRPGHDWRYSLDDAKTRGLEWEPKVSFDDGLSYTIAWIKSTLRKAQA